MEVLYVKVHFKGCQIGTASKHLAILAPLYRLVWRDREAKGTNALAEASRMTTLI